MKDLDPPLESHRYRRSQTPESPRPLHIPEPSNIPVLQNQMDPVFNDTTTYNIRSSSAALSNLAGEIRSPDAVIPNLSLGGNMGSGMNQIGLIHSNANAHQENSSSEQSALSRPAAENQAVPQNFHDTAAPNSNAFAAPPSTLPAVEPTSSTAQLHEFGESVTVETNQIDSHDLSYLQKQEAFEAAQSQPSHTSEQPLTSTEELHAHPRNNSKAQEDASVSEGVNYQSLLDNFSQYTAAAPSEDGITAPNKAPANDETNALPTGTEKPFPVGAGLPPRPPPQEKPAIHPNYSANESIRSYHQLPPQNGNVTSYPNPQPSYRPNAGVSPLNNPPLSQTSTRAPNGLLPPPPLATFQQSAHTTIPQQSPVVQNLRSAGSVDSATIRGSSQGADDDDRPWVPEVQAKYDQFLQDERNYVTEGVWDRFPPGSRLFVGNLPTEKVTKRDLFHIFHKHGRLAQISIKQAYGFVQFLEAAACYEALTAEQGVAIRGRKIHLEISKPQKNTRSSGLSEGKGMGRRRSRSPDRRISRAGNDRTDRGLSNRPPFSDYRDEPARQRRDDYRPMRSPPPRSYRGRDEYRVRDPSPGYNRWDGRPRSPLYARSSADMPMQSPRAFDDDAALPLPRRDPRDVPDVQILILEDVGQEFVGYIEQGFRSKGLRAQTIWLNPRITLAAVIKRQILEGVQAVVKLTRNSQVSGRIPLQVFDRTAGASNVNFNEYVELDVYVAADIVVNARHRERMMPAALTPTPYAAHNPYSDSQTHYPYPSPQAQHQPPPQPFHQPQAQLYAQPPSLPPQQYPQHSESSYRGPPGSAGNPPAGAPNLQELLANLRQPANAQPAHPTQQAMAAANGGHTDLAGLLSNVARQQAHQGYPSQGLTVQPPANHYGGRPPPQPYPMSGSSPMYGGAPPQQNVQNIMEQLARYNK